MINAIYNVHKRAFEKVPGMEKGLYHWDHAPRNMGWSPLQQRHVIFDLEDTLWAPRFCNIATWIGGDNYIEDKYLPQEELAKLYLDIYNGKLSTNISVDSMLDECFALWVISKVGDMFWHFNEDSEDTTLFYANLLADMET